MAKVARNRGGANPGERRGGRKKGTPNKLSQDITAKLKRLGCDPITRMAKLATTTEDEAIEARMLTELAQYAYPKRKAVDPEGMMSEEQAREFIQATTDLVRTIIHRHVHDPEVTASMFAELHYGYTTLQHGGQAVSADDAA